MHPTGTGGRTHSGTKPIAKSIMMLKYIFVVTSAGSPPSTCWHVRRTIIAIMASRTSPILGNGLAVVIDRTGRLTYPGMMPMTLLQPNRMPQQLKRLISRRYARRLTLVSTLPSCSEMPGGKALRRFLVLVVDGRPSSLVAGTSSK
jgi:hypothetical protein